MPNLGQAIINLVKKTRDPYAGLSTAAIGAMSRRQREDREIQMRKELAAIEKAELDNQILKNRLAAQNKLLDEDNSNFELYMSPYKPTSNYDTETGRETAAMNIPVDLPLAGLKFGVDPSAQAVINDTMHNTFRAQNVVPEFLRKTENTADNQSSAPVDLETMQKAIGDSAIPYEPIFRFDVPNKDMTKFAISNELKESMNEANLANKLDIANNKNASNEKVQRGHDQARIDSAVIRAKSQEKQTRIKGDQKINQMLLEHKLRAVRDSNTGSIKLVNAGGKAEFEKQYGFAPDNEEYKLFRKTYMENFKEVCKYASPEDTVEQIGEKAANMTLTVMNNIKPEVFQKFLQASREDYNNQSAVEEISEKNDVEQMLNNDLGVNYTPEEKNGLFKEANGGK